MASATGEGRRPSTKRPAYVRQETSESLFKDPIWGKKGDDEYGVGGNFNGHLGR